MIGNKQKDEENLNVFSWNIWSFITKPAYYRFGSIFLCYLYSKCFTYMGMCLRQGSIALPLSKAWTTQSWEVWQKHKTRRKSKRFFVIFALTVQHNFPLWQWLQNLNLLLLHYSEAGLKDALFWRAVRGSISLLEWWFKHQNDSRNDLLWKQKLSLRKWLHTQ